MERIKGKNRTELYDCNICGRGTIGVSIWNRPYSQRITIKECTDCGFQYDDYADTKMLKKSKLPF